MVNEKMLPPWTIPNPEERPAPNAYCIIFAIISDSVKPLDLPFFSKVVLRTVNRELLNLGFRVGLAKIQAPTSKRVRVAAI